MLMRKHHVMDGLSPTELRDILVDLGPSFIKIGQMLSLRSEILAAGVLRCAFRLADGLRPYAIRRNGSGASGHLWR